MPSNSSKHVRNAATHGERAVKAVRREAMEAGREAFNGVSEQLHDAMDVSRAQMTDWAECARDSIREKPFQALAIAVGAGVLFGLAMRISSRLR
jgi:ElaB/YqjD/DUF883 family membrane-anchored ribosome-binding protein